MRVGTLARIPVRLHWSFLLLVAGTIGWSLVTAGIGAAVTTAAFAAALFGSVVLHELGHALVARWFGIGTAHITLYPFGGIAAIDRMPRDPLQELWIALAGPAVNGVLFAAALAAWSVAGGTPLLAIAGVNLIMGVFNLTPAFPMDGGRVLRALLATRIGYLRASDVAIRIGRGFAWVFLAVGLVGGWFGLALVGGFLHLALSAERARLERARVWAWYGPGRGWVERPLVP